MSKIIAEITQNARETIKVGLGSWRGSEFAYLQFYRLGEGGKQKALRKGIAFDLDLLTPLIEGLQETERAARAEGLIVYDTTTDIDHTAEMMGTATE